MKIRTGLAALLIPMGMIAFTACPAQDGCFDDGEQVQCDRGDDDDRGYDDDDERDWDDD